MLENIITVIYILVCITIIVLVLMQEGKSGGLSSSIGGSSSSNSYWGKNKDRSIEGSIPRLTGIFAVVYIVLSIVLNVL